MKKKFLTSLFSLLLATCCFAQSVVEWEYDAFPNHPFEINHIQLDLSIQPESALIKGAGVFEITSRRPDLTQLIFNTSDIDIKEISKDGDALEFFISNDSLIIELPDTLNVDSKTEFMISWESSSPYGIHNDVYGNLWTSLNPKARHHWLPIVDHPEIATTLDALFTIPADQNVVFNGKYVEDEIISTGEKKVRWGSEAGIPVSGLTFAVGNFNEESARSGVKEISLYSSENTLLEEVRSGLLSAAVETFKAYEKKFSFEFPYDALNIVVLPDNKWEEIQSGAGVIYLYQNLGSLSTQLKRGISEQWLGNYHRYLNMPDHRYEFLKALVTESSETEQLLNPDNLTSIAYWNSWEKGIQNIENSFLKETIEESLPQLVQEFEGVTGWFNYAGFWYEETGIFWNELPQPPAEMNGAEENYIYTVEYILDEINNSLQLVFKAQSAVIESLVGVEVREFGFTDTTKTEITFTGAIDTVSVNISSGIDYITLSPKTDLNLKLKEQKPFIFLIRQLRSTNSALKIEAAQQLQDYSDNPDLQLALQDVMQNEADPDVRAALLETLSVITKGASGTEQNFLERLNSENQAIRLSAIRGLSNYPNNEQVAFAVRNLLLKAEEDTVFEAALNTYRKIASTDELLSVTERLDQDLEGQQKAVKILQITAKSDTTNQSLTIADRFALGNFPYQIREQALELLITHEQNEDYWDQTIEMLLGDRDPRIRYHALDAVKYLSPKKTVDVLVNRSKEEMDPRVLGKIHRIM